MKLSRSYVLGLGSGLILSALIAMLLPSGNILFGETPGPINNQVADQSGSANNSMNSVTPSDEKSKAEKTVMEKTSEENPSSTLIIPSGASAEKIADVLLKERWITSKEEFLTLVKQKNLASKFKAGSFELTRGMGIEEIANQLIK